MDYTAALKQLNEERGAILAEDPLLESSYYAEAYNKLITAFLERFPDAQLKDEHRKPKSVPLMQKIKPLLLEWLRFIYKIPLKLINFLLAKWRRLLAALHFYWQKMRQSLKRRLRPLQLQQRNGFSKGNGFAGALNSNEVLRSQEVPPADLVPIQMQIDELKLAIEELRQELSSIKTTAK